MTVFTVSSVMGAENFPKPYGAVNDFANVIQQETRSRMENLAREVLEKTGTSVVVATLETISDNDPAQYANDLYAAWGIGKKGEDRGVLIFLALKKRKVRIETGYGVEGILPDGLVGEILDRDVVPYLRAGDYGKGLEKAMITVAGIIAKDAGVTLTGMPAADQQRARRPNPVLPIILFFLAMAFLLGTRQGRAALPYILLMLMSGSDRRGGGGFGGSSGDFGGFGGGFGGFGGGMSGGGGAGRGF